MDLRDSYFAQCNFWIVELAVYNMKMRIIWKNRPCTLDVAGRECYNFDKEYKNASFISANGAQEVASKNGYIVSVLSVNLSSPQDVLDLTSRA